MGLLPSIELESSNNINLHDCHDRGDISCLSMTHIVSDFLPLLSCFVIPKCLCFFSTLQICPSIPCSHPVFLSSPACPSCCCPSSSVHCVLLCVYVYREGVGARGQESFLLSLSISYLSSSSSLIVEEHLAQCLCRNA